MTPALTPEFLIMAVAVGTGTAVAVYLAARRNAKHIEFAFVVHEYEPQEGMATMEQLTFDDAVEQRNQVLDDMADRHSGWLALAAAEMRKIPVGEIGLAEDFRRLLLERGVPQPKSPNVWGPFTSYMVRHGLLQPTGAWRPMRSEKSNGRVTREYRRAEPTERAA